jgi:hypothetical protein
MTHEEAARGLGRPLREDAARTAGRLARPFAEDVA